MPIRFWRKDRLESCERCGAFSGRREVWQSKKETSVLTSRAHVRFPKARNTVATIAEPQAAKKSRSPANAITKPARKKRPISPVSNVGWFRKQPTNVCQNLMPSKCDRGKGQVCPKSECLVVEGSEGLLEQAQDGQLFWLRAPSGRPLTAPGTSLGGTDDSQHGHNVFWL
jgi:hypothetical protein